MIALNALQAAVHTRLTSQLAGVPVYDAVPQGSAYPYVVIGEDTALAWDTKDTDGHEFTLTLHVWTQGKGRKAAKALMEQIYAALHHQPLSGVGLVVLRCEYAETMSDEDDTGTYYHGVMRFRALTQNTN